MPPRASRPVLAGGGSRLERFQPTHALRTPGASVDDDIEVVPSADDSSTVAARVTIHVPEMARFDERDAFIVLASALSQTACVEAQIGVKAPRADGMVDLRVYGYRARDESVQVVVGRMSNPRADVTAMTLDRTLGGMTVPEIRRIASGRSELP